MLKKTHQQVAITAQILILGLLSGLTVVVNAEELSQSGCVLCGHITDSAAGQAVTDATLTASADGQPVANVEADANGFYCFKKIAKDGDCKITIDSNEYVGIYDYDKMPDVNLKKDSKLIRDFKLSRACMLKVQVVDEANQPIEKAELTVNYPSDEKIKNIGGDSLHRYTDKEGYCLVGGIPPGNKSCLITAVHGKKTVTKSSSSGNYRQMQWDYAPGKMVIVLNDPEVMESGKIVLQKGVDVNGVARYKDGAPASGLEIFAEPEWWNSQLMPPQYLIDANGNFTLRHIVAGIYRIKEHTPDNLTNFKILQTVSLPPNNEVLKLAIPQKSPQALAAIKGRFSIIGDKIPDKININAYSRKNDSGFIEWGRQYGQDACDMNFVIDQLEPGKYSLQFWSPEMEYKFVDNVNAPSEGLLVELTPLTFNFSKVSLKGMVLDSQTNRPVQNFKARARSYETNSERLGKWLAFNDANGEFNIEVVKMALHRVQIVADRYAWTWSEEINTVSNNFVVIRLSEGGAIKGKVVNEAGKPVKGAKILRLSTIGGVWNLNDENDPFISRYDAIETGDDGVFELKYLAPGRESIKIIHPDYAYAKVNDIEVNEGQITEVSVVMPAGGIVEGYVYDNQGHIQPGFTLDFQDIHSMPEDKEGRFRTVTTDANGHYRAVGLPEQELTVTRPKLLNSIGVVCRTLIPETGKVSHIDMGGKPIVSGRITINGAPLSGRRIVLSSNEPPNSRTFCCYAMTDSDGKFAFGGVPNGKWKIYCESPENQDEWIKLTNAEVTGKDVDSGDVSARLSTIRASLEYKPGEAKWEILSGYIREENKPRSAHNAKTIQMTGENDQYIAKNIPPGEYYLMFMRQGFLILRLPIEVKGNDIDVTVRVPHSASGISGQVTNRHAVTRTLWSKDKLITAHLMPDPNLNYKLDNLPAGHYYLGGSSLTESEALLEFDLADGEQKVLDINVPDDTLKNQNDSQWITVLDENGALMPGAEVHLLDGTGEIEPWINSGEYISFKAGEGTYTLQVSFPGYKTETKQVTIEKFDPNNMQARRKPFIVRLEKK
ncbi:MAG: hypothetical protein ABSH16_05065 [Sedimentisphaerales bacterium]